MAKKLKVELDVDTSKAQAKVKKDLTGAAETPSAASAGADKVASASASAAKRIDALGAAAGENAAKMQAAVKMFGGMAIRMATQYAASNMEEGSTERKAVSAAGEIASGAMMGSMFGPVGAAAGALMGAANAWMQAAAEEKERARAVEEIRQGAFESTSKWRDNQKQVEADRKLFDAPATFGNLKGEELKSAQIKDLERRLANIQQRKTELDGQIHALDQRQFETNLTIEQRKEIAAEAAQKRGDWNRMDQMGYGLQRELEAKSAETVQTGAAFRASDAGLDALSRIGANFGGSDAANKQLQVANDQLSELKGIKTAISAGGATWR